MKTHPLSKGSLPVVAYAFALFSALSPSSTQAGTIGFNFFNGQEATGISNGDTTASLNAAASLVSPDWYNIAIYGPSIISTSNTGGPGIASYGLSINLYSPSNSVDYSAGASEVLNSDASQQLFRQFLNDSDGDSSYFNGDGIGVSLHISGLSQFLTGQSASSYKVTLFFSTDADSATFATSTIYSGTAATPASQTGITSLTSLGTVPVTSYGNGQFPLTSAGGATTGTRGYGSSSNLTANNIVIAVPSVSGSTRGTLAGFAITPIPEPSSLILLGSFSLIGLLRRRRN